MDKLRKSTLEILACPHCRGDLILRAREERGEEIITGGLKCTRCGETYNIIRGIPRLLPFRETKKLRKMYKYIEQYYDAYAPQYDINYHNPEIEYMRRVEDSCILKTRPKGTVLDIGCGVGRQSLMLASLGCEVFALDISKEMLTELKRRAELLGLEDRIEVIQASADLLPFKDEIFDRAYAIFGAYNHVPHVKRAFNDLYRVLKGKSAALLSVLNRYRLMWLLYVILKRRARHFIKTLHSKHGYIVMRAGRERYRVWTRYFSKSEIENLLKSAGFQDVRTCGVLIFLRPRFSYSSDLRLRGPKALLAKLEDLVRFTYPFNALGTYLIVFAYK